MQAGVVYAREFSETTPTDRTVSLMASGSLWRDALVMYDRETRSLWTQHDGRAIQGASQVAGRRLEALPSEKMTYADARGRYPGARVLEKRSGFLGRGTESIYGDYLSRTDQLGLFGTEVPTDAVGGKELVLGAVVGEEAHAFPVEALRAAGGAQVLIGESTFFAVALSGGQDARLWATPRGLRVESEWVLAEVDGDGRWDASTGRRLGGSRPDLTRVPARVQAWFAWYPDHPESIVWRPRDRPAAP